MNMLAWLAIPAIQLEELPSNSSGGAGLFVTGLMCFFIVLLIAVVLVAMIFHVWTIIDALVKEPSEGNDKLMWMLILIFTSLVGSFIYYFVRRPERIRKYGR